MTYILGILIQSGQPEFYATHELFLTGGSSVFLLVGRADAGMDLKAALAACMADLEYWLRFLAARTIPHVSKPVVVLCVNVFDGADAGQVRRWLSVVRPKLRQKYDNVLCVEGSGMALDCRQAGCDEMMGLVERLSV